MEKVYPNTGTLADIGVSSVIQICTRYIEKWREPEMECNSRFVQLSMRSRFTTT